MFLKVPALKEFKFPVYFSTSTLSTSKKWKVEVKVIIWPIF